MQAETELLLSELEGLDLNPVIIPSERRGIERISIDLVKGLSCIVQITDPSRDLFNFSNAVSIPAPIDNHLADLERMMSQLDDLLTPARLEVFGGEIGISVHGSWGTVEGLVRLCLESILMQRRLAEHVLAPLLDFTLDKAGAEQTLTTIITGLAASNPAIIAAGQHAQAAAGALSS